MPKILENEALALAQGIDSLPPEQQVQAADVLRRYREQQHDLGEPDWPSQEQAAQESEGRFRALFDDLKNVDNQSPSFTQGLRFSTDPDADRARVAGTAFLSRVYGKQPEEVSRMFPLLRDDYLNKRGQKTGADDRAFYSFAQSEVKRMTAREKAALEGAKAALRGEDSGKALAAWQAANPETAKEDSGFFSTGYNKASEEDGDSLPVAANLLSLLESGSFKSKDGKAVSTPFTDEQAAQLGGMVEQLAGMKPRQRKSIYRAMNARIEAAGYDQKGFWAQMLSELDRGLYRASTTLGTQAGVLGDVMEAQANASQRSVDFSMDGGGGFSTPVLSTEEQQQLQRQRDFREQVGNVQAELQDIVAGRLDPVKPTVSWLNDTIETGLIKGPGAVAPFMAASATLGPWGAGVLFTADFAEQNRRDLVGMGMDADQARQIGALAAPAQAAVESLSNMLSLGKFPAVQAFFQRFTKPVVGAGLLGRYAQNTALSLGTELTEELIQDNFVVPFAQELLGSLESDIPQVDWQFYKDRAWNSIPELTAALLPMALVFGGFMTAADAKLSERATRDIDYLKNAGLDQAQAVDVASQPTAKERIKRAASLWSQRKGDRLSMEEAGKRLSAQYRELAEDTAKNLAELEQRGKLPRMLPVQGGGYRVTYNDGSVADFQTYQEATSARWFWFRDQLGKEAALMRQSLESLEKNLEQGRELAVEISPEAMTSDEAKKRGIISDAQLQERMQQAAVLDEGVMMGDAISLGKMEGNEEEIQMLLGMSKNEWFDAQGRRIAIGNFKNDVLRTTVKLWDGAGVFTLVEEKTEGDAKLLLSSGKRDWMLEKLRAYEQASGDKLFRFEDDDKLNNKDLIEAWSHVAQAYLIVGKEQATGRSFRRYLRHVEEAGLTAAMNAQAIEWQAVVNRAQKLGELKKSGKLGDDLAAELERQLGIDSQVVHEQGAMQEAQQVAQDVAEQVDTAGYSEANPGPNGETFSASRAIPADASKVVQMPDGARLVGPTTFSIAEYAGLHRPNNEGPRAFDLLEGGISPADVYQHPEWYSAMEPKIIRETMAQLRKVKGNPKAKLTIYRAGPKGEMNGGDWVSLSKEYARTHAESKDPEGFKVWQAQVAADSVRWSLDDLAEFGYFGDTVAANDSGETFSIRAFHGTPHKVDRFRMDKLLTGEGNNVYGSGLYFAENREVAESYRRNLSFKETKKQFLQALPEDADFSEVMDMLGTGKFTGYQERVIRELDKNGWLGFDYPAQAISAAYRDIQNFDPTPELVSAIEGSGNLYTVEIMPDESEFLDWDKPLSEQSEKVKVKVAPYLTAIKGSIDGDRIYSVFLASSNTAQEASQKLASLGIPGIRYADGQSRVSPLEIRARKAEVSARKADVERDPSATNQSALRYAEQALSDLVRKDQEGTRNYVIFDENLVRILEENGQPVANETFSLRVTPAQDAEYLAAVEAGDMVKAQRMVDEAAKAAGYKTVPIYHGTPLGPFTSFADSKRGQATNAASARLAFWATDSKEVASSYAGGKSNAELLAEAKKGLASLQEPEFRARLQKPMAGWGSLVHSEDDINRAETQAKANVASLEARQSERGPTIFNLYARLQSPRIVDLRPTNGQWSEGQLVRELQTAARNGNDGVQFLGIDDATTFFGMPSDHIAVFHASQLKASDPVTRDESGQVVPLSKRFNPADDRITYSLRSGDFASRVEAMFSPFQRSPEARLVMARVAKDRALRLGNELIDKANIIRTIGSIDREARVRAALAEDEAVQGYLDSLTPAARQTLEWEPSDLKDDPLVSAMLDYGKLMSKSTAVRRGLDNLDEFEAVPWLPPSFYSSGAGITPGKMAKALYEGPLGEGGILNDGDPATLWAELGKRIEASRKDKTAHREAVQAFKDAKKAASEAATKDAQAWAENAKKQAGSAKAQRDRIKAWLRVLDGILAAAPPEVRARVGGYVKMAGIATDEAALRYLEDRVGKLDRELDKWLKKEGTKSLEKLFKKAAADFTAGKKAKGKIGPDEHYLLQRAEAASEMDASTLVGELAKLDALANDDNLTAEQQAMAELERGIFELVGNIREADAGRIFSAFDALTAIYQRGVMEWKTKQIARREQREAVRSALKADTGKTGTGKERQDTEEQMATRFGKLKSAWLSVSSFSEVLRYAFGVKSAQATALIDAERESSNTYEDEQQAIADELESLFTAMAGTGKVLDGEKLRFQMSQRSIEAGDLKLSQFEAISALLMWRQEDGKRHMEGTLDENGKRTSAWGYDQAWVDEVEKQLTPEARRVMAWLSGKYSAEHAELNPLYRERHGVNLPQHDNYAPLLVKPMQAKAGEMVDPVSGAAVSGSILTPGSLRTRSRNAIAEPDFRDALQVFMAHKKQMGYWKAYYDLAVEAQAVLGNRELMNSVEAKAGKEAVSVIRKWLDVFAQGGVRDAAAGLALMEGLRAMSSRAATVGLLGRVTTLLVQSTQLAAASVQMPVGAYLKRFGKLLAGQLDWSGAIKSDFIQRRIKSAPPIVRQAMEGLGTAKNPNQIKRAVRGLGNLLSGADGLFTGGTYAILLDYHREQGAKLGLKGDELEEYAHTEAERTTEEVAQPMRSATRSLAELTSTNPLAKVGWAYASEARQKIALFGWALESGDKTRAAKVAFLVFGVGGVLSQVLKNLWKEARGDDDEKMWSAERLTLAALSPITSGIPGFSLLFGEGNMFQGVQWAPTAAKDLATGKGDLRDINTVLATLGLFNDTAAGVAALSNAGLDFAKLVENLFSGE